VTADRICVVGCSGAGKSTFGRRCAALGYAFLELDGVFHQAGWRKLPDDEARARIGAFLDAHDRWVVDGNYARFRDLLWTRADTIVWLDPGRWTVSLGVARRSLGRLIRREELWNGNRERWSEVFSLDPERSVIAWAWTRFPLYRQEYAREEHAPEWSHLRWARLRTRREADALLARSTAATGLALTV
jgi:adenylate kinase family enzyme